MELNYEFVQGTRRDSKLVWIQSENNLYSKKVTRGGKVEYICYQNTLAKSGKKGEKTEKICDKAGNCEENCCHSENNSRKFDDKKMQEPDCTARVLIDSNGLCSRNFVNHTVHKNHELLFKDMVSRKAIVDNCMALKKMSISSENISSRELFTREIAT